MPRLLDQVREATRRLHYSIRTEGADVSGTKRFILFHGKRHPREMGEPEVVALLTHLAVQRDVAASPQNRALSAWLFPDKIVLRRPSDRLDHDVMRARTPERLPTAFTSAARRSAPSWRSSTAFPGWPPA